MRAVRFDRYGDIDKLYIADVPDPVAGPDQVVVTVRAAGLNPGETPVRQGVFAELWPASFPSGQGTDFAGVVREIGSKVNGVSVGDEVIGWTEQRASQAELVCVPAGQVVPKPAGVSWEQGGGLYVAGGAAWAGVQSVDPKAGETVVVSGSTGGVGIISVGLAVARGARVLALASARHRDFIAGLGAEFVAYDPRDDLADRISAAAPDGVDAWIDNFGGGYVDVALSLGVAPQRINTIIDQAKVSDGGVRGLGTHDVTDAAVLGRLADLVADGTITAEVAATYPLEQVREAVTELEKRHARGKIVLIP